jgi:sulfate transport system permease protein
MAVPRGRRWPWRAGPRLGHRLVAPPPRAALPVYLEFARCLPVVAVVTKGFGDGLSTFRDAMATPAAWAAIRLTLCGPTVAAGLNAVMGTARVGLFCCATGSRVTGYFDPRRSPARHPDARHRRNDPRPLRAELDLRSFHGRPGIRVLFTRSHRIALCTVTLPLVVRNVQPVLQELDRPRRKPPRRSAPARGPRFGAWSSPRFARPWSRERS